MQPQSSLSFWSQQPRHHQLICENKSLKKTSKQKGWYKKIYREIKASNQKNTTLSRTLFGVCSRVSKLMMEDRNQQIDCLGTRPLPQIFKGSG
jgi:hypothetical protein